MFETIKNAFKIKELRKKVLYTLFMLLIFRLCCYIPTFEIGAESGRHMMDFIPHFDAARATPCA